MPFTQEQFFATFGRYNDAVWPAQWILTALALLALLLVTRHSLRADRTTSLILGALWLWMGIVYHLAFFSKINPAAIGFGALFIVEGLLICWLGAAKGSLHFEPRRTASGIVGALLVCYALVVYPVIGLALGRRYPAMPTFGVPCPTTIFTLGLLLWCESRAALRLVIIPVVWSVLGLSAALSMSMTEDYGLLVGGVASLTYILLDRRRIGSAAPRVQPGSTDGTTAVT